MQVNMKAKQIREIKSYRTFQFAPEDMRHLDDFEFVFSKDNAYKINIYTGDTLRVKSTDERTGEIVLTGKCQDPDMAMKISKWLTTFGVTWFRYEKTILEIEV